MRAAYGVLSLVIMVVSVQAWSAPSATFLESHGIEIEVPAGWAVTNQGGNTTIMPTKYRGRGIQVSETPMPATTELVTSIFKTMNMQGAKIQDGQRNGAPVIVGSGTMTVKDKGNVEVELLALTNSANHGVILMSFIKADSDPVIREANEKLLLSARVAGRKMTLVYEKPRANGLAGYPADVVTTLGAMGTTLDGLFRFPRLLPIKIRECGVVNAFYSSTDHAIIMCHEFWDDTLALFKRARFDDAQAVRLTRGTVMFAFFHEFGHALVGELGLPITGKGEDAADEIATIFLGQAKEFGRQSALSGASWFKIMADDPKHRNVFYDEHSFDEQRVVSIACVLYGSDQKTYSGLMTSLKIPAKRQARCVRDYRDRLKAWNSLIEPHMKLASKR